MKKGIAILLCVLLIAALAVGWRNRQAGETLQSASFSTAGTQVQETTAPEEEQTLTNADEEPSTGAVEVVREYADLPLSIHAQCSSPTEAGQKPVLTARYSQTHFEELFQELFLPRFPGAVLEETSSDFAAWYSADEDDPIMLTQKNWHARDEYGHTLGYIRVSTDGDMAFEDLYIQSNGQIADDSIEHPLAVDENAAYTGTFTQEDAIDQAFQTLQPYTDFDLVLREVEKRQGGAVYDLDVQLAYQGTPISIFSQSRMTQLLVLSDEEGISYISDIWLFDQIQEGESSSVMSLDDALANLEEQAPLVNSTNYTWEVYRIQLEYFGEQDDKNDPGLYTFRPVWAFYYTFDDGGFDSIIYFYADTGALCAKK